MRQLTALPLAAILLCSLNACAPDEEELRRRAAWPKTVTAAADSLLAHLPEADRNGLARMRSEDLPLLHLTLGAAVRNDFGLRRGNDTLLASCGPEHAEPEACAGRILQVAWDKLQALQAQQDSIDAAAEELPDSATSVEPPDSTPR